jgi:hypothetical protein
MPVALYRTTVPGHPRCIGDKEPSHSLEDMEARVENRSSYPRGQIFILLEFKTPECGLILKRVNLVSAIQSFRRMRSHMFRPDDHKGAAAGKTGE